jgi:adenine deaminase
VREGSAEHNLEELLPALVADELGDWCLCTDDLLPTDLRAQGHIDALLRRVIAAGVPPARAIRHASLVPARHYGLHDRGAVAPGLRADLVVVDDLHSLRCHLVFKDGRLAAREGHYLAETAAHTQKYANTVHLGVVEEAHFDLKLESETFPVIQLIPGQIVTGSETRPVRREQGRWVFDPTEDVLLTASLERHRATGRIGRGLVSGFGLRKQGSWPGATPAICWSV